MKAKRYIIVQDYNNEMSIIGTFDDKKTANTKMINSIKDFCDITDDDIKEITANQKSEDFDEYDADIIIYENYASANAAGIENEPVKWTIFDLENIELE